MRSRFAGEAIRLTLEKGSKNEIARLPALREKLVGQASLRNTRNNIKSIIKSKITKSLNRISLDHPITKSKITKSLDRTSPDYQLANSSNRRSDCRLPYILKIGL